MSRQKMWKKISIPRETWIEDELDFKIEKTDKGWIISQGRHEYKYAKDLDEAVTVLSTYFSCPIEKLVELQLLR